jgi:hypothetical protein
MWIRVLGEFSRQTMIRLVIGSQLYTSIGIDTIIVVAQAQLSAAKPRLRGEAHEIRFADDAVLCFQYKEDAEKVAV